ncbi:MAG TPA: zf-HC2 domain-containing protein, partial [Gemmataceae bacterium]|nr:zf-HC2 domain-containing protein [Gemmataceae bacterium]
MTDHAWAQEHIAAAVVGGLTAAEAERFDAHVRDCPECATAFADARTLDRGLGTLFADVRPGPALADRTIDALRAAKVRRMILSGWKGKLAVGLAASVGLGAIGAGVAQMAERGLVFPGDPEAEARVKVTNHLKQLALAGHLDDAEDTGSRVYREAQAAKLDGADALADKAGAAARTHWSEITNGSQSGWNYGYAQGRYAEV